MLEPGFFCIIKQLLIGYGVFNFKPVSVERFILPDCGLADSFPCDIIGLLQPVKQFPFYLYSSSYIVFLIPAFFNMAEHIVHGEWVQ